MSMLRKLLDFPVVRFGISGILNTLFGLLMIYLAKWLSAGDISANIFGYACGLLLNFKLNSNWTFRYQGRLGTAFYKFMMVILVAWGVNMTIVLAAISHFNINPWLAQAIGVIPYAILSYLGLKYLVFKNPL